MSIPDRSRPVLVIGGSGFAGSYTVRALHDAGYDVVVCDLNDYQPESRFVIGGAAEGIPVERGSIDNWPRVLDVVNRHRPGAIVHLASIMDLPFLDQNPMVALKVNVEGTVNLLEAARFNDVQRFVFFSTIGVIPQVKYEPIDAAHPVVLPRHGPRGAYSVAKLCGEGFCFAYEQSFGLDVRVIRPSALYGFGMSALAPNYMKQIVEPAVRGEPVRLPTGGPVPRDYVHVLDVASLVVAVLEGADDTDRIYYGATGEPLRTGGDVGCIARELLPGAEIEIGDDFTESDRAEQGCRGQISIENAKAQLGWSPRYSSLRDGMAEYIERYRAFLAAAQGGHG